LTSCGPPSGPQNSFSTPTVEVTEHALDLRDHWERVYREKDLTQVSWYQDRPDLSLSFVARTGVDKTARILDVGAGTSALVDNLLDAGYQHLGVLDVSATAIGITQRRLGDRSDDVEWFISSVTEFESPHPWDVWHDRAVLHFLTEPEDQASYRTRLEASVADDGAVVVSTFGPEGPERCSGLDVHRYGLVEMTECVGPDFTLDHHEIVEHATPGGGGQQFLSCLFRRTSGSPSADFR